jgi:hypothetical protein
MKVPGYRFRLYPSKTCERMVNLLMVVVRVALQPPVIRAEP